ncbi:MAG: LysE family translocator [Azoarcus sp.]|nr:LysE family translocator [Azoarcus sp.]
MPTIELLASFLTVSVLITLAPGPDNLMVLAHSLARGRSAGLGIALGCALGCFTHTLWAALGVTTLLAASPDLFMALKLAGAAYLAWLGVQALRNAAIANVTSVAESRHQAWLRDVKKGFIANAINPKVALFFLAFLPQFAAPEQGDVTTQMIVLGLAFALQTTVIFGTVALTAASIGRTLARHGRTGVWLDRVAGIIFIGLAAKLALDDTPL